MLGKGGAASFICIGDVRKENFVFSELLGIWIDIRNKELD